MRIFILKIPEEEIRVVEERQKRREHSILKWKRKSCMTDIREDDVLRQGKCIILQRGLDVVGETVLKVKERVSMNQMRK